MKMLTLIATIGMAASFPAIAMPVKNGVLYSFSPVQNLERTSAPTLNFVWRGGGGCKMCSEDNSDR